MNSLYRLYDLELLRQTILSPSLTRLTFGGADVKRMATFAPDQRVKLFFPMPEGEPARLAERYGSDNPDWYVLYRQLPEAEQPPMRSFAIRHLRRDAGEVDVDFALHGEVGQASRWALRARIGDSLSMSAPDAASKDAPVGFEWRPSAAARHILIAADETAVPAAMGILEAIESWAVRPRIQLVAEVPTEQDRLPTPDWVTATWLTRRGGYGDDLIAAIKELDLAGQSRNGDRTDSLADLDIESQILWETQVDAGSEFYAWIAAEAKAARDIRLYLVRERGLPRQGIACMGYWREGRTLS